MPSRRDVLAFGASATLAALARGARASSADDGSPPPTLQTRLFNFKDDVSADLMSDLLSKLKAFREAPGIDGLMIGRNLISTQFPGRFEWIYMVQPGDPAAYEAQGAHREFSRLTMELSSHCRNEVECDLGSSFPARFADAAGVRVRHTVMFDFKPDASPEARERNVAAIRGMGRLPMVKHYVVERAVRPPSGPTQLEWQVIGDFGSVEDYRAYSQAPAHLSIREDFTAHTSRVAFLDVDVSGKGALPWRDIQ
jgi:hypothetical protein